MTIRYRGKWIALEQCKFIGVIKIKTTRVEQHRIKKNNKFFPIIDDLCWKSKNMYNYGNYIIRQEFIQTSKEKEEWLRENANWIKYNELFKLCKESDLYKELGSNTGQATLRKLDKTWKSFFESIKDYSKNPSKYRGRPKMPKYLDKNKGRYECGLDNNKFKIKDGYIFFCWKPLKVMNETFMTKIPEDKKLIQLRFVPKNGEYIMEVVYEIDIPDIKDNSDRIAAIDLGIDNLMTITTNCGIKPFIINGKPLKSVNQYYNKIIADKQSELKKRYNRDYSNEMRRFTTKRNHKIDDYIQKATKMVVDFCKENNIDTLVCGYNSGWKQESDMSKKVNQKFVGIPYLSIVQRLAYKCETEGIIFRTTDESYTSGTSFLDGEQPVKENYDKSRRVYRGLFVTKEGEKINADVNGSYQIMKKVFPNVFDNGIVGAGSHPLVVNIPL